MALTRLSKLKSVLNLDLEDSSFDDGLSEFIRRANFIIRDHCNRFQYGLVDRISNDNPAVCRSIGHGLVTGDKVRFFDTGGNAEIEATAGVTATVIDEDQFSIGVDHTSSGDAEISKGHYVKQVVEYLRGNGRRSVTLTQVPIINDSTNTKIYVDNDGYFGDGTDSPFGSTDELTIGTEWTIEWRDTEHSITGQLFRINSSWPEVSSRVKGEMSSLPVPALGNIKAQYWTGYRRVPLGIQTAVDSFIARLIQTLKQGGGLQSENIDYYSYTRVAPDDERKALDAVKSMLKKHKTWIL